MYFKRMLLGKMGIAACTVLILFAVAHAARKSEDPTGASYDLVIANGRVMDPESGLDAARSVGIRDGKIVAI